MSKKRILIAAILSTVGCYTLLTEVWFLFNIFFPASLIVLNTKKDDLHKPIDRAGYIGVALFVVLMAGGFLLSSKFPEFDEVGEKFLKSIYFAAPLWLVSMIGFIKRWRKLSYEGSMSGR